MHGTLFNLMASKMEPVQTVGIEIKKGCGTYEKRKLG